MDAPGLLLFDTALGRCGIAWGPNGLVAVELPGPGDAALRAQLRRRAGTDAVVCPEPPAGAPQVARAVDGITALLAGAPDDLTDVMVDMAGIPPFHQQVYAVARAIPPGATFTYGEVADRIGAERGAARAVGQALGANPFPIVVPCHRITAAGGRTGGFSAPGGVSTKLRILEIERVHAVGDPTLF